MAKQFYYLHQGQFVAGKAQFVLLLLLYFKDWKLTKIEQVGLGVVLLFGVYLIGFVFEKAGFRQRFMQHNYKGVNINE